MGMHLFEAKEAYKHAEQENHKRDEGERKRKKT